MHHDAPAPHASRSSATVHILQVSVQYVDVDGFERLANIAEGDLQTEARRLLALLQQSRTDLHERAARAARAEVTFARLIRAIRSHCNAPPPVET